MVDAGDEFRPADVISIDLEAELPDLGASDRRTFALVRLGVQPIGTAEFQRYLDRAELAQQLWADFADPINDHLELHGRPALNELSPVGPAVPSQREATTAGRTRTTSAVVIATHNRQDKLRLCLDSLAELTTRPDQIIVVDSAPSDEATKTLIDSWQTDALPAIEYVREEAPGLARAHNASLDTVRSDVVVFTDDDVIVDPHWLAEIVGGFDVGPHVGCVTGMIVPVELETWPQQWAESTVGFNKGFSQLVFDLDENRPADPLFPFTAGTMGSGANMAFTAEAIRDMRGFDIALGAGTTARGGDDLAAFYHVIDQGRSLVYQPSAIVFHHHRRDEDAVESMAYGYGAGLTAYLTSVIVKDPRAGLRLLTKLPRAMQRARSMTSGTWSPGRRKADRLARRQRTGMLLGPLYYLRSLKENETPEP